jgi:hypothetical protein
LHFSFSFLTVSSDIDSRLRLQEQANSIDALESKSERLKAQSDELSTGESPFVES